MFYYVDTAAIFGIESSCRSASRIKTIYGNKGITRLQLEPCYHIFGLNVPYYPLDRDTAISVANTIVGSRIDYCNSLLYGVHDTHVKYATITEIFDALHWLPVWSCIHSKVNLITFKAIALQ